MILSTNQKQVTEMEAILCLPGERAFGVGRCKWLHLGWMGNGVLLYSTGYCAQPLVRTMKDSVEKKVCLCVSVCTWTAGWLCCRQKLKEHCKSTIVQN